jgi:hypothetical protein
MHPRFNSGCAHRTVARKKGENTKSIWVEKITHVNASAYASKAPIIGGKLPCVLYVMWFECAPSVPFCDLGAPPVLFLIWVHLYYQVCLLWCDLSAHQSVICQHAMFLFLYRIYGTITVWYGHIPYYTVKGKVRSKQYKFGWPYFAFLQGKRRSEVQFPVRAVFFTFSPQFFVYAFPLRYCVLVKHWKYVCYDTYILKKWAKMALTAKNRQFSAFGTVTKPYRILPYICSNRSIPYHNRTVPNHTVLYRTLYWHTTGTKAPIMWCDSVHQVCFLWFECATCALCDFSAPRMLFVIWVRHVCSLWF